MCTAIIFILTNSGSKLRISRDWVINIILGITYSAIMINQDLGMLSLTSLGDRSSLNSQRQVIERYFYMTSILLIDLIGNVE